MIGWAGPASEFFARLSDGRLAESQNPERDMYVHVVDVESGRLVSYFTVTVSSRHCYYLLGYITYMDSHC